MIKVMIVDNHQLIQNGLSKLLETDSAIKVTAIATSGEQAYQFAREQQPDIILMDINMEGLGTTRRIHQSNDQIKILVLTAYAQALFPTQLIQAGPFGYLTKGCDVSEILEAIHAVYSGQNYLCSDIVNQLTLKTTCNLTFFPFDTPASREIEILVATNQHL